MSSIFSLRYRLLKCAAAYRRRGNRQ